MRGLGRAAAACSALLLAAISSCGSAPPAAGPYPVGDGRRILFIGNSLTYVNDLPGILQALADSAGGDRLVVETVASPDFALVDHWNEGKAARRIADGGWEIVVLQQGPSSVEVNRDSLRLFTARFATEITRGSARPALYSVWPTSSRRHDFARAIESYTLAAADVNGMLFPVASAWLAVWERDPNIQLYGSDGLHPSLSASYLAACVMYGRLFNRSPVGLPARLRLRSGATITIEPRTATLLQEAAAATIGS